VIHALCRICFAVLHRDQAPWQMRRPNRETCCHCGFRTEDGIYVRNAEPMLFCDHEAGVEIPQPNGAR